MRVHLDDGIISYLVEARDLLAILTQLIQDLWLPIFDTVLKGLYLLVHFLELVIKLGDDRGLYLCTNIFDMALQFFLVFNSLLNFFLELLLQLRYHVSKLCIYHF